MCLIVEQSHPVVRGRPKVATADRHYCVYKRIHRAFGRDGGRTPHRNYMFRFGQLLTTRRLEPYYERGAVRYYVDQGLHAFRTICAAKHRISDAALVPCIIPKGAKLYYGERGEVVSDKLIIFSNHKDLVDWLNEQGEP